MNKNSWIEEYMEKDWTTLWNAHLMDKFDEIAHVKRKKFKNIDTLISSLQVWEPVSISYILEYYSYTDKRNKNVLHIVSAYSFDEKWVWVSETVTGRRLRISWDKIFNMYWNTKNNSIFRYDYQPMNTWSEEELALEQKHNFLVWEY